MYLILCIYCTRYIKHFEISSLFGTTQVYYNYIGQISTRSKNVYKSYQISTVFNKNQLYNMNSNLVHIIIIEYSSDTYQDQYNWYNCSNIVTTSVKCIIIIIYYNPCL